MAAALYGRKSQQIGYSLYECRVCSFMASKVALLRRYVIELEHAMTN